MGLTEIVTGINNRYILQIKLHIWHGNYNIAFSEMTSLYGTINGAIATSPLADKPLLYEYELRALALVKALERREKDAIDGSVASFEELLSTTTTQPAQITQDDLVTRVKKEGRIDAGSLREKFLSMYKEVCGDYGRDIFESRVLPAVMEFYAVAPSKAIKMALRIIETAAEYNPSEINNYLASVRLPQSIYGSNHIQQKKAADPNKDLIGDHPLSAKSPKKRLNQKTLEQEFRKLEQKFRKLRSLIIIHNGGTY